jgi:hypothetical protein
LWGNISGDSRIQNSRIQDSRFEIQGFKSRKFGVGNYSSIACLFSLIPISLTVIHFLF